MPPYLRTQADGLSLSIWLQPRASRNAVQGVVGEELKIRITAPPVDSAANEALLNFLAEKLDCPRRLLTLTRGHASKHKTVLLRGLSAESVERGLSV